MGKLNNAVAYIWNGLGLGRSVANHITDPMDLEQAVRESIGGGGLANSGVHVTTNSAKRFAAVSSCVRVLSNDVAQLPLSLYRRSEGGREPATDLPLYNLLKNQPNEWQTSFDFRRLLESDKQYRGNGYAYIIRDLKKEPDELIRMHPDKVRVKQDDVTLKLTYEYTRLNGRRINLEQNEVFQLRGPSDDGIEGLTAVQVHRETIGDGLALREHGSRFFSNGARPGGVLQTEQPVDPPSKRALREDFESLFQGVENSHKIAVLDQGVKYNPMTIGMADAQFLEARKYNRAEICGIYGVPPHRIGDLENAHFTNIEHQALQYVYGDLMPILVCWEQTLKKDLIEDPDLYFRFNVNALLRGDAKSRAEALGIQRRNGVLSANEWRELEERNRRDDDGGDGYIIESNMQADDGQFNGSKKQSDKHPEPSGPPRRGQE